MVTKTIDVRDKKITVQELIAQVREGVEIILAEGDQPVARLLPVLSPDSPRQAGLFEGSIWTSDDFDDPLPDEFWLGEDA
jgi:antitoxin (DNA-binding transcriptional repressor) of toxin-antitoxin stability system